MHICAACIYIKEMLITCPSRPLLLVKETEKKSIFLINNPLPQATIYHGYGSGNATTSSSWLTYSSSEPYYDGGFEISGNGCRRYEPAFSRVLYL